MQKFIWDLKEASIEFKEGIMTYFDDNKTAATIDDVMYFYYDVIVKSGRRKLQFRAGDYPKVQDLKNCIDHLISHKTEEEGYLLENVEDGGFYRKIRYHQAELSDWNWREYFIRLEKYCYEVKQEHEETAKNWVEYKLTIGELAHNSESESGLSCFFNCLTEEQLKKLSEVAEGFVQHTILEQNKEKALLE